jgi:hypothetical protein
MHNFDVRWGGGGGLYRSWRQLGGGCGSGGPRPLGGSAAQPTSKRRLLFLPISGPRVLVNEEIGGRTDQTASSRLDLELIALVQRGLDSFGDRHRSNGCSCVISRLRLDGVRVHAVLGFTPEIAGASI